MRAINGSGWSPRAMLTGGNTTFWLQEQMYRCITVVVALFLLTLCGPAHSDERARRVLTLDPIILRTPGYSVFLKVWSNGSRRNRRRRWNCSPSLSISPAFRKITMNALLRAT